MSKISLDTISIQKTEEQGESELKSDIYESWLREVLNTYLCFCFCFLCMCCMMHTVPPTSTRAPRLRGYTLDDINTHNKSKEIGYFVNIKKNLTIGIDYLDYP